MSKLSSIFVCGLVASIFSFSAQAFPGSPPSQVSASDVTQVRDFCGSAFTATPGAPAFQMARRTGYIAPLVVAPAAVSGRTTHRVSIRLLLLCPIRPVRPHALTINPLQDVSTDGVLE